MTTSEDPKHPSSAAPSTIHFEGYNYTKKEAKTLVNGDVSVYYRCCHWRTKLCTKKLKLSYPKKGGGPTRTLDGMHYCTLVDRVAVQELLDVTHEMGEMVKAKALEQGSQPAELLAREVLLTFESKFSGK